MTIIKNLNKNTFTYFLIALSLVFFSCGSQTRKVNAPNTKCKIYVDNLNRVTFSENYNSLSNIELTRFYDDKNDFDVIIYDNLEGSNNYNLKRFYKSSQGAWIKVTIINDNRTELSISIDDTHFIDYLKKVEERAYYQYCGTCFDCRYYTFLIKNNKSIFKYYSNGEIFIDIDKIEKEKLLNYIKVYDFFSKK